jgi:hypothetical protein
VSDVSDLVGIDLDRRVPLRQVTTGKPSRS